MKNVLASSITTNVLLFLVAILLGMGGYIFDAHVRMPWHGDVGVRMAEMQKDIHRIQDALGIER